MTPGSEVDPLLEIKKIVAAAFGWLGIDAPDINLAVVNIIDKENQREQLALGGDLRGDSQFIIADTRNNVANNLYWPTGQIQGNKYKIENGGVNRTLQHQNWWDTIMELCDYTYCELNSANINVIIDNLMQAAGKSINYVQIYDPDY